METLDEWVQVATVDPEVRAYVYSLVTAVGGSDGEGRYILGDDALACLKDLRRWLKFYDQRMNRYDVARCLAEANLVKGDLVEILAQWPENATEDRLKSKHALACMELMVPLTWPFEREEMTMNHHRHIPYLQLAQINYKRCIIHYDRSPMLRTAIRVSLPSMAQPRDEREPRDEGIIRLILYFIRNITQISPSQNPSKESEGEDSDISRAATINAFHEQDVFQLLLSISSSMGEEFILQDVVVLEILFHLLKGVDAYKLFMEDKELATAETDELRNLMQKEKSMLASYARHAPTRHNRFGSMIWLKQGDDRISTVVGQDVLGNFDKSLQKMDKTKKWNKPNRKVKQDEKEVANEFDTMVPLSTSARKQLRGFVEEFLDSSFNPLFTHLRKAIEREADRILRVHPMQFFYLISWFLQAECARRELAKHKATKGKNKSQSTQDQPTDESFALVASVLNQETFVLLNRHMQRAQDDKQWQDLNAGMKCFTQILLTVQQMADSPLDDDQDIAENIQNRIFYEESTHERVMTLVRSYNGQGFGYLDACTELSHVFLRLLEKYSKQNVDLQVRSRRRARKQKRAAEGQGGEDNVAEADDIREAALVSSERKFDFHRFSVRFMNQACVNTFVAFTKYFNDLSAEQLKRAHRFFYRLAFKMELAVLLYRVDILVLFQKMIKGPNGLDSQGAAYKEWEELVRQVFRKTVKKLQERPELFVEMLFSKIPATLFFLEHGHDKEPPSKTPRPPAEMEVKSGMTKEEEIGVAVGVLINQSKMDALGWVKDVLSSAADERQAWADSEAARKALRDQQVESLGDEIAQSVEPPEDPVAPSIFVKADNQERRAALFKDNKLRLLLKLLGFERLGPNDDPEASWIIPSSVTAAELKENLELIKKLEFDPPTYEDGKSAEDFLRSKSAATQTRQTRKAAFDDDSEDDGLASDEELFPVGGPTARKSDALKELKKSRRKRNTREVDDEEKQRRAETRRKADEDKRRKIKSELFVHDSDDETDEERDREFFEREKQRRDAAHSNILKAISSSKINEATETKKRKSTNDTKKGRKKRRRSGSAMGSGSDGENDDVVSISSEASSTVSDKLNDEDSEMDDNDDFDTPLSSQLQKGIAGASKPAPSAKKPFPTALPDADSEEEDEDEMPPQQPMRRAMRAGFVVESDSE